MAMFQKRKRIRKKGTPEVLFPGDVLQTIKRRKDFSGNQAGYCDGYAGSQSLTCTVQIDQPDTAYAYCLLN